MCNTIEENYRERHKVHLLQCLYFITIDEDQKMNIRWFSYTVQPKTIIICVSLIQATENNSQTVVLHHSRKLRDNSAGILEQSMWARNRVGIWLSYRPARLHRLAESFPWNRFLGSLKV
jgi:hypothetical protein